MRYKTLKFILIFFVIISIKSFAQFDYSFSGYIVDLPVYSINNEKLSTLFNTEQNQIINLTRIRLRPEFYLWERTRLNVEYEIDALYLQQQQLFGLTDINTNRQLVDLNWTPVNEEKFILKHFIDRLYLRQGFNWGNVIIGRQRISWGTGRIWNPTDLFNPINPANFTKIEKDGADAVSLTYYLGSFTDLNLVYNPVNEFESSNYGFRFRTNFAEYDVAAIGGYFDKRVVAGLDFAGNLYDAGVRGEGILSMNKDDLSKNFISFILGIDNQFTSDLYAMLEYHYNGEGKAEKINYELLRLVNGEILNLGKNYIYASVNYSFSYLINGSLGNNINLNDGSGFTNLILTYSLTGNSTLGLGAQLTYGKELTEYWYYPNSIFLQGEFYF